MKRLRCRKTILQDFVLVKNAHPVAEIQNHPLQFYILILHQYRALL